jgi:hypothetical protein
MVSNASTPRTAKAPIQWSFYIDHIRLTPLQEGNGDQKRQHDATN